MSLPPPAEPSGAEPLSDGPLGEFERIRRFFKPLAAAFAGSLGLANDAAVFGVPDGMELVVTSDAMVAGIHFFADDDPEDVAAKLLRVNLSDLAAMGAAPLAYTLVTAFPAAVDDAWIARFSAGLAADQEHFGIGLAGGDSVRTSGPITLSVTAFGLVPKGQALPRSGARPGDTVFVTGTIGDAALGLQVALGTLGLADPADAIPLLARLRRPDPRTGVGIGLRGLAHACIDVSDGLVADLAHICRESACAAVLEADAVPFSGAARAAIGAARAAIGGDAGLLETALTGGDDYELLFTAAPESRVTLDRLAAECGVPITAIGRMEMGPPGRVEVRRGDGSALALQRTGWRHF